MKDQSFPTHEAPHHPRSSGSGGDAGVIDFASWVVALLAARNSSAAPRLRPAVLAGFRAAVVDGDPARLDAFLRDLVRQKVPAAALADLYIPALARALGDDWLADRASFLEVTLAASRMQSMLRAIGMAWTADSGSAPVAASLLLVVPRDEQHSLGAMVLLGQLRRLGVSVRLVIAPRRGEVGTILSVGRFSGVLVSVACTERLADVRSLAAEVHSLSGMRLPVVVGGHAVGAAAGVDLRRLTGADAVTGDLTEALAVCGLELDRSSAQRRA